MAALTLLGLVVPGAFAETLSRPAGAVRELSEQRTARSSTWQLASGAMLTQVSTEPVHWQDDEGRWRAFDLALRTDTDGSRLVARPGRLWVELPKRLADGKAGSTRLVSGDDWVQAWLEGAESVAETDGDSAAYEDALAGVDVRLTVVASGIKEDLVLAGPRSRRSFGYRLAFSDGLIPRLDARSGAVTITRDGREVFVIPRATIADATGVAGPSPGYRLVELGAGEWRLSVSADSDWIDDPARSWPVVVDPTTSVTETLSATTECWPENSPWTSCAGERAIGNWVYEGGDDPNPPAIGQNFESRGLLKFPIEQNLAPDQVITRATLQLYNQHAYDWTYPPGAPLGIKLSRVTANWTASPASWSAPTDAVPVATQTLGATPAWISLDVTGLAQSWQMHRASAEYGAPNFGLKLTDTHPFSGVCSIYPTSACPKRMMTFGQTWDANAPRLEIVSWPAAPAGAKLLAPREGQMTGRRVTLQAKASDNSVTGARFQYVAGTDRTWREVPAAALRFVDDGTQPASSEIAVSGHESRPVVWDLQSTPGGGIDGSVHVRAILEDPTHVGGGATPIVNFRLDRRNTENAPLIDIGPGQVNALTGDFVMTSKDAEVDAWLGSLGISRTYHSRGVSTREAEMFGPHWTASFEGDGGTMPYRSLYNHTEIDYEDVERWVEAPYEYETEIPLDFGDDEAYSLPLNFSIDTWQPVIETLRWEYRYAEIGLVDGGKLTFSQIVDPEGVVTGWEPDEQHPGYSLTKAGGVWTLKDPNGNTTTFSHPPGASADSPNYQPMSHKQPGSSQTQAFDWSVVSGRLRLNKVTAPRASNFMVNPERQDRYLRFAWTDVSTPQGTRPRVTAIHLGRWNPSYGLVMETVLASYGYDTNGRLTSMTNRASGFETTTYSYDSGDRLAAVTTTEESPWQFAYSSAAGDGNGGRLESVSRGHSTLGTARWSVRYGVPLSGAGAPRDMSPGTLASWGQVDDLPTDATAVFPPDQVPATVPASWTKATVHYLDADGLEVNTLEPGEALSARKYDANGNLQWELSAANRERALASGGDTATEALLLSTIYRYAANGVDEQERLSPAHTIELADGTSVRARTQTLTVYDTGKPNPAIDYHLPTSVRVAPIRLDGNPIANADKTITVYEYDTPDGWPRGWELRSPTKIVTDSDTAEAGRLNLTTRHGYEPVLPLLRWTRTPGSSGAGNHETTYSYFGIDPSVPRCADNQEYTGLVCRTVTPNLTTTFKYSLDLWNETQRVETGSGGTTRTTSTSHTTAGRELSRNVTGSGPSPGLAVPHINTYYTSSGQVREIVSQAAGAEPQRVIERTYDGNGRLSTYIDADGATTTYTYDLAGRVSQITDSKATTTFAYDDRGQLVSLLDSTIGAPITGTYDADGNLIEQTLPNGLTTHTTYNELGDPTERHITKPGCSNNCSWPHSQVTRDVQGRWVKETTDSRSRAFQYDGASRLTVVEDQPNGGDCVTRKYTYDAQSNRTARTSYAPDSAGACTGTGTPTATQALSYDAADRINTSGFAHDALGRITNAPASALGRALTATHDVNDRPRTLNQDGLTHTYGLDPLSRVRSRQTSGTSTAEIQHYGDDTDSPTWIQNGSAWTRYITGLDGELVATRESTGAITYELNDLHGDTIARASASTNATAPIAINHHDEFGTPIVQPRLEIEQIGVRSTSLQAPDVELALPRPTGTQAGDLLLVELYADAWAQADPPSGWQLVEGSQVDTGTSVLSAYWRIAGSEPSTTTFEFTDPGHHHGAIKAFRNVDPTQPPTAENSGWGIIPEITPLVSGSWISAFAGAEFNWWTNGPLPVLLGGDDWNEYTQTQTSGRTSIGYSSGPHHAGVGTGDHWLETDTTDWPDATGGVAILLTPALAGFTEPTAGDQRHSYLGAHTRPTEFATGIIQMGARTYIPQLGRFLQVDPVDGGSANAYDYAYQDPLNLVDLDGCAPRSIIDKIKKKIKQGAQK